MNWTPLIFLVLVEIGLIAVMLYQRNIMNLQTERITKQANTIESQASMIKAMTSEMENLHEALSRADFMVNEVAHGRVDHILKEAIEESGLDPSNIAGIDLKIVRSKPN